MKIGSNSTVGEARQFLKENISEGTFCPCCNRVAKLYKFKIYHEMGYWLIELVKRYQRDGSPGWVNHKSLNLRIKMINGNYAKLRHWGLVEKRERNPKENKPASGFWRPTVSGIDFVHERIVVPRRAYLFNNKVYGFSKELIGIREVLGDKFNYMELMSL